jgi:hypothetical protein
MPKADPKLMEELHVFNDMFMRTYFSDCVLEPDEDLSVKTWLDSTHYPKYRRDELYKIYKNTEQFRHKKTREVMVHGKDESYSKFAEARGIYSRSDEFKIDSGPLFAKISKKFFAKPYFFKNVRQFDKIKHLKKRMAKQGIAWDSDFSSFESTFQPEQMEFEFNFYKYCCGNNPNALSKLEYIKSVLTGKNICKSKYFTFEVDARRMSGEMNTSLGNSYFNLLISAFIAYKSGNSLDEIMASILIEGDDCLCKTTIVPDVSMYEKLGAKVKQNYYPDPTHASFCGMIFDMDAEQIIVDPIDKLLNLFYTNESYLMSNQRVHNDLLKAKAMSLLYSYPGCPIIGEACKWIMRNTVSADPSRILRTNMSVYEREKWNDILKTPIPFQEPKLKTRLLMEEKFSIPVSFQLRLENHFKTMDKLAPWSFPELLEYCKSEYTTYYDIYSLSSPIITAAKLSEKFL